MGNAQLNTKRVLETDEYAKWIDRLRGKRVQLKIDVRVKRLAAGNSGDYKHVGNGVFELRIDYGPGYRVYYIQEGNTVIILLAGGDKSSQSRDIEKAKNMAASLKEGR